MEPYFTISIAFGAVILALHIASAVLELFSFTLAKILAYVNLGLHIPFVLMLLLAESEYDTVALALVGSTLVYTVAHFVVGTVLIARNKREEGGEA